jgi:hypothetical protein
MSVLDVANRVARTPELHAASLKQFTELARQHALTDSVTGAQVANLGTVPGQKDFNLWVALVAVPLPPHSFDGDVALITLGGTGTGWFRADDPKYSWFHVGREPLLVQAGRVQFVIPSSSSEPLRLAILRPRGSQAPKLVADDRAMHLYTRVARQKGFKHTDLKQPV